RIAYGSRCHRPRTRRESSSATSRRRPDCPARSACIQAARADRSQSKAWASRPWRFERTRIHRQGERRGHPPRRSRVAPSFRQSLPPALDAVSLVCRYICRTIGENDEVLAELEQRRDGLEPDLAWCEERQRQIGLFKAVAIGTAEHARAPI